MMFVPVHGWMPWNPHLLLLSGWQRNLTTSFHQLIQMLLIAHGRYFSFLSLHGNHLDGFIDQLFEAHWTFLLQFLQRQYPSALTSFEQILKSAKGKRIALFLDYDGTLSPIVDNPDCAFMSDAVRTFFRRTICELPLNFSRFFIFLFFSPYISINSLVIFRCVLLLKMWQSISLQQL